MVKKGKPASNDKQGSVESKKDDKAQEQQNTGEEHKKQNRMTAFYTRFITTMLMLGGLILTICLGHTY